MTATAVAATTAGRNVPLEPGELVGDDDDSRWRVARHIADGGFSSVYEVVPATAPTRLRHGAAGRALKCLWGTPAEITAIGGEAAKMAAVEGHPNVLGLVTSFRFELSTQPRAHYVGLVLELAAEDLPRFAARVSPSERAWAGVFEQVAAGLEHIHGRRVVHGDIKPTNVLRVDGRFAVADFGVSASLEGTRSAGIGLARTIAFWPPESASQGLISPDGVRLPPAEGWRATQSGDVWALAVSMHRLLTGRHITPGTTPEQQYELVCHGKYRIDDGLGPEWRRLLSDCLVQDPAQRVVSTAGELRARLAELALADQYAGVPWPDGQPRVVAVLDLGHPPDAGHRPPAEPNALAGPDADRERAEPGDPDAAREPSAAPEPEAAGDQGAAPSRNGAPDPNAAPSPGGPDLDAAQPARETVPPAVPGPRGAEPAESGSAAEVLVLYQTAEGGRVHGTVLRDSGLLLAATRHLTEVAVPALAQQVRDSQRAVLRLVDEQQRTRSVAESPGSDDPGPSTVIIDPNDAELTRELSVAVAGVARQRDELAQDRDRLVRHRDALTAERDRLRQQYADLARRMDRLEADRTERERSLVDAPTTVLPTVGRTTAPQPRVPAAVRPGAPPRAAAPTQDRRSAVPVRPGGPVRPPRVVPPAPRRRRHPVARMFLVLLLLLILAATVGVVGAGLATHRSPVSVVRQVVHEVQKGRA